MKKKLRSGLAVFMAFAMLATYSFGPQNMVTRAYAEENEVTAGQDVGTDADEASKDESGKADSLTEAEPQDKPDSKKDNSSDGSRDAGDSDKGDKGSADKGHADKGHADRGPAGESTQAEQKTDAAGSWETENTEAAESTEAAEEEQYPAAGFSEAVGQMTVDVRAPEGALPEGTTIEVKHVRAADIQDAVQEEMGESAKVIRAVDITFFDRDGNAIEPKKQVSVTFAYDRFKETDAEAVSVVHITDKGDVEKLADRKVEVSGDEVAFESGEFSIYAVVETGQDARLTVRFMSDGAERSSVMVKERDIQNDDIEDLIYDPGVGTLPNGVVFKGWTTEENYTTDTEPKTIEDVIADVETRLPPSHDGDEVIYYAMLFKQYTMTYTDGDGVTLGQETVDIPKWSDETEQSYTVNMPYTSQDDIHHFEGWKVVDHPENVVGHTEGAVYQNETEITVKGDVKFSTEESEGYWFIFHENGKHATYNAPQFIVRGETPTRPKDEDMVRNGYSFGGWFADEATANQQSGGTVYDFERELTGKTDVYARWIARTQAPYTVIVWKQNISGDGYDFEESIQITADVGSNINAVTGTIGGNTARINNRNFSWTGFHYASNDQAGKTVATEGNTVVNVYFDRNEYTLTFIDPGSRSISYTRTNNQTGTAGIGDQITNTTYLNTLESNKKTISGYEVSYYSTGGWLSTTRYAIKLNGNWYEITGNNTDRVYNARSINRVTTGVLKTITALYQQNIGENFPIEGAPEGIRWQPQNSSTFNQVLVYIDVMPGENITFHTNSSANDTRYMDFYVEALPGETPDRNWNGKSFVKYGNTISAKYGFFTEAEDFIDLAGFVKFGSDPAFGSNGRANVEAGGTLHLYYTRHNYALNFMDGVYVDGNGNPLEEPDQGQLKEVAGLSYGSDLTSYNKGGEDYFEPTLDGYVFEGWYIDKDCTQAYTFSTLPTGGLTVYAKWRQIQYRVFLHPNAGTDTSLDWGSASQEMNFRGTYGARISVPEKPLRNGYKFIGWYRNEAMTQIFNQEAFVLNDTTVTTPYDKTVDMTNPMDKWGNIGPDPYNSDITGNGGSDRFWITKKLDLYGKWSKELEGAQGIGVYYELTDNAGHTGTGRAEDTHLYIDNATATAVPAIAAPSGFHFDYWVMQQWNETTGRYEDIEGSKVYPGRGYTVLADNARKQLVEGTTDEYTYTIQLRAHFTEANEATQTKIYWYANGGTGAGGDLIIDPQDGDLNVNEAVDVRPADTFTREGYTFKGWARVAAPTNSDGSVDIDAFEQDDSVTPWLTYDGSGFKEGSRDVTQVAADEKNPYHALFAVWQKTLKITVNKKTTEYNGAEQSGYTISSVTGTSAATIETDEYKVEGLIEGDVLTVNGYVPAKGTAVGTYTNGSFDGATIRIMRGDRDVTSLYDIETVKGDLEITKVRKTVRITGNTAELPYNGSPQSVTGYTAELPEGVDFTQADIVFSGNATASGTNVGEYPMGLAADQFSVESASYLVEFEIVSDGKLDITPLDVTVQIKGTQSSLDYDGEEHTAAGYEVTSVSSDLYAASNITFSGTASASRTDAGTTNMGLTPAMFGNTDENFNVTFEVTDGYQKINKINAEVTITGSHSTDLYDKTEHSVTGYEVTSVSNPLYKETDFTFSGTAEAKRTNIGTTNMGLAAGQFTNQNPNFETVTFTIIDGYQTITEPGKVTVTITGNNNTTDYDGSSHTITGYTVDIACDDETNVYSESDFTFTGTASATRTDQGQTDMGLTPEMFRNTNPNFTDVEFVVVDGYQKINRINVTVTITGHNDTKDYDGSQHSVSGYDVQISNPLYKEADFSFNGTASAARTEAGTTYMGLKGSDDEQCSFTNNNGNFNVTFAVTDGFMKINKINATVTIKGTQSSLPYDGVEHTASGYEVVSTSTPLYTEADFTFSGDATAKRTDKGKTNMGLAAEQFTNDNPNFETVTFTVTDGYQEITAIDVKVTIVGANSTLPYDGDTHTVTGYTAAADSALYDVDNDITFTPAADAVLDEDGNITAARKDKGTTHMGLAENQFENGNNNFNVTFEVTDGYQTITPIDVVVTIVGANSTLPYDGDTHTVTGYTASADSALYDVDNDITFTPAADAVLDEDGNITAARKDKGTTHMGLAENQFENRNSNFNVTFEVTDGYQTITPIDVVVTIVGANSTLPYDGDTHTVTGYTATADSTLYNVDSDFTFSGTAEASQKDAGIKNMGLAASQFTNTNPNFGSVTFEVTDGYQEITAIDVVVTIVGANSTDQYDGAEHSVSGYTATADTDLYDVNSDFTFSGTAKAARTAVGTTNMGLKGSDDPACSFTNTNTNFATVTFNVTDGYQTITPPGKVVVTITGAQNTTVYDGAEHSVSGYTVSISDPLYTEADFTFTPAAGAEFDEDGRICAARTASGTTNMGLEPGQFTNNNDNFTEVEFVVVDGYQAITKKSITVTIEGNTDSKTYNGAEQKVEGYSVTISDPLYTEGDFSFSGTAVAKGTNAGQYPMGLAPDQFTNDNENFEVTFSVTDGSLDISKKDVTVTIEGNTDSKPYSGVEQKVEGYSVTISDPLYTEDDFSFSGTAVAKGTNAGPYAMGLKAGDFTNDNTNFNVNFTVTDGNLTITPLAVTVTIEGNTDSKPYSGVEQKVEGYSVTISDPLYTEDDFSFSGTAVAKGTDVGSYPMGLAKEQFSNTNDNFDVTFTVEDGELAIEPLAVTVTIKGNTDTKTYNGDTQKVEGYSVTISDPLYTEGDFSFSGTAVAEGTDVGSYPMGLAKEQFSNTNNNFEVAFTVEDGELAIEPLAVTVTIEGAHSSLPYDGESHTANGYTTAASSDLYDVDRDISFSGTASATRTDAGTTYMNLAEAQFSNTNDNFTVTFGVTDGYQTITAIDVTVTIKGHTSSVDYDGTAHTVTGYDVSFSNELYTEADFTFSGSATATRTVKGKTYMGLAADQFTNTNTNFGNVTFVIESDGYQEIKPIDATVTIIGNNETHVYDGTEYTASGYTATYSTDLYTAADYTFSGSDTVSRTNEGTSPMGLKPADFANTNENFANVTFEVTDGYVTIEPVGEVTVKIKGKQSSLPYDGNEHSVSGYEVVEISDPLYKETDFTFSGDATASQTNAGKDEMGLKPSDFTNTNGNFATVTFIVEDGYQEIKPIDVTVTITGHNSTLPYDGEPHTASGYEAVASNSLYDVDEDMAFTGTASATQKDAGTANMGLDASQFRNTNPNFANVTFNIAADGYQTITPIDVEVTIVGNNDSVDYDGVSHEVTGYEVTEISDPLFTEGDITFSGRAVVTGIDADTYDMGLDPSQFSTSNPNFGTVKFNVTDGYLEIKPIDVVVTIVGRNDTTDYDGGPHTVTGYQATSSLSLYDVDSDFTFSGNAKATRTEAGTTYMGLTASQFTNTNTNFANVTFQVTDGYQTIDPIDVTVVITGANDTTDYDGENHTVNGYTATCENELYDVDSDFTFTGEATATQKDAGTAYMNLTASQFTNTNTNFANVTFQVTDGYQTIDPIDVTVVITGKTGSADYDGLPHTTTGYTATCENALYDVGSDFTFSGNDTATRTDAGNTPMGLKPADFANTNANFANVTFQVTDGSQTIKPIKATVNIRGDQVKADYDGEEHTAAGYEVVSISTPLYKADDFSFDGPESVSGTGAGAYPMGLLPGQFTNKNGNFSEVTFVVEDGYVKIDPIDVAVTIIGNNVTRVYDGTAHTASGYTATYSTDLYTAADYTFSGSDTVSRTNEGTSPMGLKPADFANTNENFANVTFEVTDGYVTIEPVGEVTVKIKGKQSSLPYDGNEHSVSGYEVVEISDPLYKETDFTFSGDATASQTNAGKDEMGLKPSDFTNTNGNFREVNFVIIEDGYQEITPLEVTVTITGANDTTDYDGKNHTASGYTAAADSDLYDVDRDISFSGTASASRTDAGTTHMNLAPEQFANTNDNFDVTFEIKEDGFMTIDPIDVTVNIEGEQSTDTYDGKTHTVNGYTATCENELYDVNNDFTFSGTATASRQDKGTTNMNLAPEQFANTNPNFANVTFQVTDGSQTIDPLEVTVTITGNKDSKVYDGEPHSAGGYTVSTTSELYTEDYIGFDGPESVSRTDYGVTPLGLDASQFANTNENFDVTFVIGEDGQIAITKRPVTVTITGHTGSLVYNGEEQKVEGYDTEISDDLYTEADFTFGGTDVAKGTNVDTYPMGLAESQFTNDNENFDVTFTVAEDGQLEITPLDVAVTIRGTKVSETYDGKPHTAEGYEVIADSELYKEEYISFTGTDSVTETDADTYPMGLEKEQFSNTSRNFTVTFTVEDGELKIDPLDVIVDISGNTATKPYTGSEQSVSGYEVAISDDLFTEADITFSGTAEAKGTDAKRYAMGLDEEQFSTANTNFNVTFRVTDGWLEITKITGITVTAETTEKPYDGKPLTSNDVTVTGLPEGFTYEATNEGSATNVRDGAVTNSVKTFVILKDGEDVTKNFEWTPESGTLSITPRDVKLESESANKSFDGKPLTKPDVTINDGDGDPVFEAEATARGAGTITQVGEVPNTIEITGKDGAGYDAQNYTFNKTEGTLTITEYEGTVVVTAPNLTKKYDGTPLSGKDEDVTVSGLPDGYTFEVTVDGSKTNVSDEGKNEITSFRILDENRNDVTREFETAGLIVENDGTLTITPRIVTLTSASAERVYNGEALTKDKVTVSGDGFVSGEGVKFNVTGSRTNAGTSPNTFTYDVNAGTMAKLLQSTPLKLLSINEDNYKIKKVEGTLTVDKRPLKVTTPDAEKVYDGSALRKAGKITGLVKGETVTFKTTGSRTEVGTSTNGYSLKWDGTAKKGNYTVIEDLGDLTVTAAPSPGGDSDRKSGGGGNNAAASVGGSGPGVPGEPVASVDGDPISKATIDDDLLPHSDTEGAWALINLICMIITAVISLLMLLFYFIGRRDEDEETGGRAYAAEDGDASEQKQNKKLMARIAGLAPAIISIIAFFVTEDMTLPMQMVDKWTILMVILLAAEAIVAVLARKKNDGDDSDEEGYAEV